MKRVFLSKNSGRYGNLCALAMALALYSACAPRYSLRPVTENRQSIQGISYASQTSPKCLLQAGFDDSTSEEVLVHIRATNQGNSAFDIDYSSFSLTGPSEIMKESPLSAVDPEKYVRELLASADAYESRTKMESYQGIDELNTLKGSKSDQAIEAAGDQYREKRREAKDAAETAKDLRARADVIRTKALMKTSVAPGKTAEGVIVFRSAFKDKGAVVLESNHPQCKGQLDFDLIR